MNGTDQPEEPTLADVLAAVRAVGADVNSLAAYTAGEFRRVDARLGQLDAAVATVSAKVDQARADIAAVKVDTAFAEAHNTDLQNAMRAHLDDPNAHGGHAA